MPWSLYLWGNDLWYQMNMSLIGLQNWSRYFEESINFCPTGNRTTDLRKNERGLIAIPTALFLSMTNKIQRYTVILITVSALHVSGGFSAHHQELKNCTHICYMLNLLAATANGSSKQVLDILKAERYHIQFTMHIFCISHLA
jgi:hypothetical protein